MSLSPVISDNRSYDNNTQDSLIEDNRSNFANITVSSSGDRFFENGLGALVGGGLKPKLDCREWKHGQFHSNRLELLKTTTLAARSTLAGWSL